MLSSSPLITSFIRSGFWMTSARSEDTRTVASRIQAERREVKQTSTAARCI